MTFSSPFSSTPPLPTSFAIFFSISSGSPFRVHLCYLPVRVHSCVSTAISISSGHVNSVLAPISLLRRSALPDYFLLSYSPLLHPSLILISFVRSPLPLPGPGPSCGGSGLGAPVIPPSRAGFPLRPRPREGPGVSSPRSTVPQPRVARAPAPGSRGSLCPLPGCRGGGGVCRQNLTGPGGGTGPGASAFRRTPSAVREGQAG